jgi:lactoylglutathione lyase
MKLRYTLIFVRDLEHSIRFYRDLIGLPVRGQDRASIEFETGVATLVLHQAHMDETATHHPPMIGGTCRLGFYVEQLDSIHRRLVAAGVRCVTPPETRLDLRVGLYEDPDGVNFTLAEPVVAAL